MAFTSLGATRFCKLSETEPNTVLVEGWYTKVEPNKFGGQTYFYEEVNGQSVGLDAKGHLAFFMRQCAVGDYLRIMYLGQESVQTKMFGLKSVHKFAVDKDPARTRGVNPVTTEIANTTAPTEDDLEF